ncbi:MAG: permease, partial [Cyanobacteria bacterium J06639_1]
MFSSPLWQDGVTLFLGIVVEAIPFLLLGVLLSGLLSMFASEEQLLKWLPEQPWLQSLAGGMLGFFFPVCECGNVAVARRLILKGIPPHVAIAFLLAAPVFNPVVIFATWVAFRFQPEIVV